MSHQTGGNCISSVKSVIPSTCNIAKHIKQEFHIKFNNFILTPKSLEGTFVSFRVYVLVMLILESVVSHYFKCRIIIIEGFIAFLV